MKHISIPVMALAALCVGNTSADARGGRFLGSMLARGAGAAVRHAPSGSTPYESKVYSADTLTVSQLAECLKRANGLDSTNTRLESDQTALKRFASDIERSESSIEEARNRLDRTRKSAVDGFNKLIEKHNALVTEGKAKQSSFNLEIDMHDANIRAFNSSCAKKYYTSDLPEAQKIAGIEVEPSK